MRSCSTTNRRGAQCKGAQGERTSQECRRPQERTRKAKGRWKEACATLPDNSIESYNSGEGVAVLYGLALGLARDWIPDRGKAGFG